MADYKISIGAEVRTSEINKQVKDYKGNINVGVNPDGIVKGINAALNSYKAAPIEVNSTLNTQGITDKLTSYSNKTNRKAIKVDIDPDLTGVGTTLENYSTSGGKPLKVKVDINWAGVKGQIQSPSEDIGKLQLNAELNSKAISSAIKEFNKAINSAESNVKVKVKVEPNLSKFNSTINKHETKSIKISPQLKISEINKQIGDYNNRKNKRNIQLKAKLADGTIDEAITKYVSKEMVPVTVDFKVGGTKDVDTKIASYKNTPIDVPVRLMPAKTGFDTKITTKPVQVSATINKEDIKNDIEAAVGGYTPTAKMPINIKLTQPKDINEQVKGLAKPTERIDVGVKLDESNLNADIALFQPTATLGVKPDLILEYVDDQIRSYVPKANLKVNVELNDNSIDEKTGKKKKETAIHKIDEQIGNFTTNTPVKVGVQLNFAGVWKQIKDYKTDSKVKVGIQLNQTDGNDSFENQIKNLGVDKPIELGVSLNLEPAKAQIEELRKQLEKFGKITINFGEANSDKANVKTGDDNGGVGNGRNMSIAAQQLREVDIIVEDAANGVENLKRALDDVGFNKGSIDEITKEFDELGISVKNVTSRLHDDGSVTLTVKGVDQFERAVKVMRSVDEAGNVTNLGTTISQDFKETENAFKKLKALGKEINQIDVKIAGLDANKNKQEIESLIAQLNRLEAEYNDLFDITEKNLSASQIDELAQDIANNSSKIDATKARVADRAALQRAKEESRKINEVYTSIYNTKKRIGDLEVELIGAEANDDAETVKSINDEITRLKNNLATLDNNGVFSSKFTSNQNASLTELDNQIEYLKTHAKSKIKDDLTEEIQFRIDTKEFEKDVSNIEAKVKSLGNISKDLQNRIKYLKSNKTQMDNAFKAGDIDKAVKAYERYIKVLKSVNNELKIKGNDQKFINTDFNKLKNVANELDSIKKKIEGLDTKVNTNRFAELSKQLEDLQKEYDGLYKRLNGKLSTSQESMLTDAAKKAKRDLDDLKAKIADTKAALASKIKISLDDGTVANQVGNVTSKFNNLKNKSAEVTAAMDEVNAAFDRMNAASGDDNFDELIMASQDYERALKSLKNQLDINARAEKDSASNQKLKDDTAIFQSNIDAWLTKNSAAAKKFGTQLLELKAQAENCDRVTLDHLEQEFKRIDKEAEAAGLKTKTFGDSLKAQFQKYSSYFSVASLFMYAGQALRSMFEQVKLIDSAMTELKKVTNETDASYNNFLSNAASRAKELGTTIDGLVASTADFARLGYGFEEAQGLAEVANIYAVVGDEIEGVEDATQSLVSTLAAFKQEMNGMSDSDFAMSIVDKMNEVSNNFAISSGGIGQALQRSASSMAAANNSLDETIALITAANEVAQNPEKVGKWLCRLKKWLYRLKTRDGLDRGKTL